MSYVESHAQHFGGRILVSGQRSKALKASSPKTNRNGRKGRPKFELSFSLCGVLVLNDPKFRSFF